MKKERILPERELIRAVAAGAAGTAGETGTAEAAGDGQGIRPFPLTVEETFEELEQLLDKLEDEGSSLEESFGHFERGMKLVKSCSDQIDKVEKQMIILSEEMREGEEDDRS